ncbi:MAG TPA: hypothetical protein VF510_19865 [Ktedonobacterales bacterium]
MSRGGVSYCDDGFLGSLADKYWSTFTYIERLESGTFGSDSDVWWNRRWKPSNVRPSPENVARWKRRTELFGLAVKRAYRGRFGKGHRA